MSTRLKWRRTGETRTVEHNRRGKPVDVTVHRLELVDESKDYSANKT